MDKELIEFWNKFLRIEENDNGYRWWYDKGGNLVCAGYDKLPETTLDSLFEHAVPKLDQPNIDFSVNFSGTITCEIYTVDDKYYYAVEKTPQESFYNALREVLC